MSVDSQIYAALQRLARSQGRATSEILTLYALEAFLDRLTRTSYQADFILKGGVLLAAYHLRRPTRDIDMQAINFVVDDEHLRAVVGAVADVDVDDGLAIDPDETRVELIRAEDSYSGLRVHLRVGIYNWTASIHLDISTGDPIWPEAEMVRVPRLLGGEFEIRGHPIATIIAEKAVTMLQRGASSTRWRDLVDVRSFAITRDFPAVDLRIAAQRVADYRSIGLSSVAVAAAGWSDAAQVKWSAWRAKLELQSRCLESFEEQLLDVVTFVDPVFTGQVEDAAIWRHADRTWRVASK